MFCLADSGFSEDTKLLAWAEFLRAPNSKNLINAREENESIRDAKTIYDKALDDPVQRASAIADSFARK